MLRDYESYTLSGRGSNSTVLSGQTNPNILLPILILVLILVLALALALVRVLVLALVLTSH